jgi:small GTP-binding protein
MNKQFRPSYRLHFLKDGHLQMERMMEAKVVLLGAASVGKTCLLTRAVADFYDPGQEPTVGTSFSAKTIQLDTCTVKLWIWDTAGQERFRALGSLYYQGAQAVILVFSLSDRDSLSDAERWATDVKNYFEVAPLLYLIGNKADLVEKRKVSRPEGLAVADKLGAIYMESSARTGQNVNQLFENVADKLRENEIVMADRREPEPATQSCLC